MTAYRDSFEKCPRCAVELNDAKSARGCPACGGLWLDEGVLHEMVLEMLPPGAMGRLALEIIVATGEPALACPTCGEVMAQTAVHQVPIERCAKQHGVWFDRDELGRVLYAVGQAPDSLGNVTRQLGAKLRFTIAEPGGFLSAVDLAEPIIKVGRVPSCHIRIEHDPDVSRMHAVIEVTEEGPTIIDLGSTAGTLVNGERVNKRLLQAGDSIRLGDTVVTVTFAP